MRWLALCCSADATAGDADALGWLALRFTPRVARLEEALVAEVSTSLRLFRGARALRQRLQAEAAGAGLALGAQAWAPTALAALALARCPELQARGPLAERLDALPLRALTAAQAHHAMLARLGCTRLGELRRLPRAALAKRFGPSLLLALDRAYGEQPEAHDWLTLPDRFSARLELPWRVEHAPVLLHFAETLLRQLCAFLAARHAGVRGLQLAWQYDAMRPRDVAGSGELTLATADTTRDLTRLIRLLAEHLARTTLAAPAGEITLRADTLLPLEEDSAALLPERGGSHDPQERAATNALLERLSVRLGAARVCEGQLLEDHRLDRMQRWQPWPAPPAPTATRPPPGPQPTWLVEPPQPLRCDTQEQPVYAGPLTRISGPHRVEAGWWEGRAALQTRDYFVYRSATRGLLWVFHERMPYTDAATAHAARSGWFLHGVFA
ncbi:DNA polymerase Y family protein [Pelomonas cellulosilytica]|uniref:DNA polymerase Y family protein n=1 Tax=Pelomonas cellulosilytica TaxID=2906762 RepID=A0ABS8XU49_9BURK|nr:DNA polymerase Y family protein [Pelomonas sp. P8]MCE4556239.1 DNA polymerase Y family protein [Pelomonas sp. P8]